MKKVYQKCFKFVMRMPRSLFSALGGSPSRYWGSTLILFGLLLAGITTFSIYFFISTNNKISAEVVLLEESRPLAIDRDGLSEALEILQKRENSYAGAITAPLIQDPSI